MQVEQMRIIDFLGMPDMKLVVPVYQRVYSWKAPQLRELWDDVLAAGRNGSSHFVGTVFYAVEENAQREAMQFDVIDGQQRLTTLTLLLCALRDHMAESKDTFEGMDAEELADAFLKAKEAEGIGCKVVLSRADAPTLRWIVCDEERPKTEEEFSKLVNESYEWFKARMSADGFDFDALAKGLKLLEIIAVRMERCDRPQTVFESLNSKGLPLSTPDLVRNHFLSRDEFGDRSYLYDKYWANVEDAFAVDEDDRYLAHAIRIWTGAGKSVKDDRGIFNAFRSSFAVTDPSELERRTAGLAEYCVDFHKKIAEGDESTLALCREWEESRGKAERLRNDRKTFGD